MVEYATMGGAKKGRGCRWTVAEGGRFRGGIASIGGEERRANADGGVSTKADRAGGVVLAIKIRLAVSSGQTIWMRPSNVLSATPSTRQKTPTTNGTNAHE